MVVPYTAVGDYINTIKTAFDLNFDFYQAVKQHVYWIHINKEVKISCTCKLKSFF